MPATQRGSVRKLPSGKHQLRYYDANGERQSGGVFATRSGAWKHYREVIEPQLRGEPVQLLDLTLAEFAEVYLERHAAVVRGRTVKILRERLGYAARVYGDVPLSELERMSGELAGWRAKLPAGSRFGIMAALRQTLGAAVDWGYLDENPAKKAGKNPQPPPRPVRPYTFAELDRIALELSADYEPLPDFAAATGLRPEEWMALERRDVDRAAGLIHVRRTVSDGQVVELGKTSRSRRQVPLSRRGIAALDRLPLRFNPPLLFAAPKGGLLNLDNFRRWEWDPAIEAANIAKPARIYDLRSTFASNALAAGVTVFELAKIMGTSVRMIERHYGALLDGAGAGISGRLDALETELEQAATEAIRTTEPC
jgi:integrase